MSSHALLELRDLSVKFSRGKNSFLAVQKANLSIHQGETLSLVGESGSGKTTIGRAIMGIHPAHQGDILYKGQSICGKLSAQRQRTLRQEIQMVFQDPVSSLNERAKVDYIVSEGIINFKLFANEADRRARVDEALRAVGLMPEVASRFPHEFSGGQRQRIGLARALIMKPRLIIADEPISALDVSIRAQIINLMNRLKRDHGLTYLFIAHDLSVVRLISDRIAVIHHGKIIECAEAEELFTRPLHPYTRALLSAIPIPEPELERNKKLIVYDPSTHDYHNNPPSWMEPWPNHGVLANQQEVDQWTR